ncbi:transcription factor bHLH25-like [Vigna umbellata]|uniref:transcription factor bHLH25-like n=1 Tax=Vigna umbellata TaxID=87088 RepID=UPI001F5E3A7A|nr:transcription factor bHLH25-like [Vigna umbellata]
MEDSWQNWLSHLGMNDNFGCTSNDGVLFEEMMWLNSAGQGCDSSNNEVACMEVKEEHSKCCWRKRGVEKHQELEAKGREKKGTKRARTSSEIEYHIISERKRRQDIAEKFIALSATIPGLKKIDKVSILGEAIKYMRQLQQRIAVLEKASNNNSVKPFIIAKSHLCSASCSANSDIEVLPEVEASGLENEVLIRIYCEKRKDILLNLMTLLKGVHLSVTSSSVLPFGNSLLNIIIVARMSEEYNLTVTDLVKTLKQNLFVFYEV